MPVGIWNKLKKGVDFLKIGSYVPKVRSSGGGALCQEVVHTDDADVTKLPIIQCWPEDGGKYITFGQVVTKHPETGARNLGMYRVQIFGPKMTAMHWHMHHDGARHFRAWAKRGEKCPLAITLGGESVLPYAATAPLPPGIDEHMFAGFLQGRGLDLVPCKTVPLEVSANCEIVIEGWVDPKQTILEGPFGDHTGFYSLAGRYPVFNVTAITHRKINLSDDAHRRSNLRRRIFTSAKRPNAPSSHCSKIRIPDIIDYDLPMFGVFHSCALRQDQEGISIPLRARVLKAAITGPGRWRGPK